MYAINPIIIENRVSHIFLEEDDHEDLSFRHAVEHGFVWETKEQAEMALTAFLNFGRRYRMAHDVK